MGSMAKYAVAARPEHACMLPHSTAAKPPPRHKHRAKSCHGLDTTELPTSNASESLRHKTVPDAQPN
eukprot:11040068-Alexandrium_andersonii.AAC.1